MDRFWNGGCGTALSLHYPASNQPVIASEVQHPLLRKSGPCEVKSVMSDQDLVNCGATPR